MAALQKIFVSIIEYLHLVQIILKFKFSVLFHFHLIYFVVLFVYRGKKSSTTMSFNFKPAGTGATSGATSGFSFGGNNSAAGAGTGGFSFGAPKTTAAATASTGGGVSFGGNLTGRLLQDNINIECKYL